MEIIWNHVARIIEVSDAEIAEAMRAYFEDTHNAAEGAGAASLAAALREKERLSGTRTGIVLTGGNVDTEMYGKVLTGVI
jgi:threonine dehydratase